MSTGKDNPPEKSEPPKERHRHDDMERSFGVLDDIMRNGMPSNEDSKVIAAIRNALKSLPTAATVMMFLYIYQTRFNEYEGNLKL